jgi:hypothetical protein
MRSAALLLVISSAILLAVPAAGAQEATSPPRVTLIGDSVAASVRYVAAARSYLSRGFDLQLHASVCRRLVARSCRYHGTAPPTALQTIRSEEGSLGKVVVVDVGYNDASRTYRADLDSVMRALVSEGAEKVIWVTLHVSRPDYRATDEIIRAAPSRWPQLTVADWSSVPSRRSWFRKDGIHLTPAGALALAHLLRPLLVEATGSS